MEENTPSIQLTLEELKNQLEEVLARAKRLLPEEDYEIIKGMADTITFLSKAVGMKNARVQKLLTMLFGTFTGKMKKISRPKEEQLRIFKEDLIIIDKEI